MVKKELPCKVEIKPVSPFETHIFVNGKEIKHIREYSIKQKAGYQPIITVKLNGQYASYSIDTEKVRWVQPNVFRELWFRFNNFLVNKGLKSLTLSYPYKKKKGENK